MKQIVSWVIFTFLLVSSFTLALRVKPALANGAETVYINSDGTVTPGGAPIIRSNDVIYTLSGDINYPDYYGIVVQRSNIVIDGAGHAVKGNLSGTGLNLTSVSNVTIQGINVSNFQLGINVSSSNSNMIIGNNVTANNSTGIYLYYSPDNMIIGNNLTSNIYGYGIILSSSNSNTVSGCNASANSYGIVLYLSANNTFSGNTVSANKPYHGVFFNSSNNNTVSGNSVTSNSQYGIWFTNSSSNNTVSGNNIRNNQYGLDIRNASNNNRVVGNNVTSNTVLDIQFYNSSNHSVVGNNITNSPNGIRLYNSSNNTVYHNNFVGNTAHTFVDVASLNNAWNDSYPSGGNYWDNYTGVDSKNGPNQDMLGSDGIGDTPYVIDANNQDHYPLMTAWIDIHDVAVTNVTTCKDGCKPFPTVPMNFLMHINVTVENQGNYTETFTVTLYATNETGSFAINQTQLVLPSATLTVWKVRWNATLAYGNYTISAIADTVLGETETADNTYVGTKVEVTIPGDVNGDLKVQPGDLAKLIAAYGSPLGPRPYNPNCDLNDDHQVGPGDLARLIANYGKHYP